MSTWRSAEASCSNCGATFRAQVVSDLHVTRSPEVRQAILDEKLHVFDCPGCGARVVAEEMFIYTDLERHHFLGVFKPRQAASWATTERDLERMYQANIVEQPTGLFRDARFELRTVYGLGHLREKLLLWDARLDDRIFEAMKMYLLRDRPELAEHHQMVLSTVDVAADRFALLAGKGDDGPRQVVEGTLELYRHLETQRDALAKTHPELFTRPFADLRRYLWV